MLAKSRIIPIQSKSKHFVSQEDLIMFLRKVCHSFDWNIKLLIDEAKSRNTQSAQTHRGTHQTSLEKLEH